MCLANKCAKLVQPPNGSGLYFFIYISTAYYPPDDKLITTNSAHCKAFINCENG